MRRQPLATNRVGGALGACANLGIRYGNDVLYTMGVCGVARGYII